MCMLLETRPWIGPDSFFASLPWDILMAIIMGVSGIIALVLGVSLIKKYRNSKSRVALFLGLAMLTFIVAMFVILPTLFIPGGLFKIVDDLVARLVGLIAITCYLVFAIELFIPRAEQRRGHTIIPLVFICINALLIALNFAHVLTVFLETGSINTFPTLLIVQEFLVTLPFLYIAYNSMKLSGRAPKKAERKALRFISWSGVFMFLSYLFLAIDDLLVLDNFSALPMWVFAMLGFIYFYLGVARPKKVFKKP